MSKEFEALVDYLIEYEILGDAVCDLINDEDEWCEKTCDFSCPQRICIMKMSEILAKKKGE